MGQLGSWIGSILLKDQPVQQPGKTRSTRRVEPWPNRWSGQDLVFFLKCGFSPISFFSSFFSWLLTPFKVHYINTRKYFIFSMWDLKTFNIYTLCSQDKGYFFNVRFKILLYIYSMFIRKKLCFFNVGFEALSYIYSMFTRKKLYFFNMG